MWHEEIYQKTTHKLSLGCWDKPAVPEDSSLSQQMELHPSSACLGPEISFPKPASHKPEGLLGPGSGCSQMPPNQQAARSRQPGYKVVLSDHHHSAKSSFVTLEEGRTAYGRGSTWTQTYSMSSTACRPWHAWERWEVPTCFSLADSCFRNVPNVVYSKPMLCDAVEFIRALVW